MHCPSLPCTATGMQCHILALYITRHAAFRPAAALLDVRTKQTNSGWSTDLFPTQSARHNVARPVLAVQLDACEGPGAGQQLGSEAHVGRQAGAVLRDDHAAAHCQLVHSTHLQQLPPVGLHLLWSATSTSAKQKQLSSLKGGVAAAMPTSPLHRQTDRQTDRPTLLQLSSGGWPFSVADSVYCTCRKESCLSPSTALCLPQGPRSVSSCQGRFARQSEWLSERQALCCRSNAMTFKIPAHWRCSRAFDCCAHRAS